jgi:PKD repeat protein
MKRTFLRSLLACSLTTALLATSVLADPERNDDDEVFPNLGLRGEARGGDAVTNALGNRLPEVARWYRKSEGEFRSMLKRERDAVQTDRVGMLHFVCAATVAQAPTTLTPPNVASTSIPDAQTFLLHSRPGATRVIYLDFDGHTTSGTSWNSSYTAGAAITTPAYSTDSSAAFSTTELSNIREIWQRVSEDYAPFDVDVTTEDPGLEALRKTSTSDLNYGIRVVIGGSSGTGSWFTSAAGGVAYLGSFTWNSDTPCFVFPAQLGNGYPKYVAEAAAHEVGHTFGLSHDGQTNGTAYYQGHANWAPIMGVGYYKDVVQWSKGDYSLANNTEDDLAKISSIAPYRPADHGADIIHASPLTGTSVSATGIIETTGGADVYSFATGAGQVSFAVKTDAVSPNLDARLAIYDGAGNLITSANPTTMGSTLTTTLAQGTYYVAVDGVGTGAAATAYTNYDSLGQYALTGTVLPVSGQAPVAVATKSTPVTGPTPLTVNFSSVGSYDPDGTIATYDWDFGDGTVSTLANPSHTYTAVGTYTASLVVFDNSGLSSSTKVTISVQSNNIVYVSAITMSLNKTTKGYQASAVVTVKDQNGAVKPNATVTGTWSGLATGTGSAVTNTKGQASFNSARINSRGTFTFTVTGITFSGSKYDATKNLKTSASIATP